jgi:hypothetical protein
MGMNDGAGAEKKERRGWEKGCRVGGGLGRVMTWMAVRPENGTENKVSYDKNDIRYYYVLGMFGWGC